MAVNLIQGKQIATASWAQNAVTASYATQALSASFAISSSRAISSSFTTTASFVTTAQTASFVTGSNVFGPFGSNSIISASFAVSSSRALIASHADNTSGISSSITNNVDNYLLTATGGSTINGESNLTFDGILLSLGQAQAGRFRQGGTTDAYGTGSHAEGQSTGANGDFSHAEGRRTIANGNYSHTEGYETVSSGSYQHVQGQFNISSSAQSAFIIGNGIDNENRSNLVFASGSEFQVTGSVIATQGFITNWGTGDTKTALFGTDYPFGVNNRQILFNDISNNDFNYQSQSIGLLANVEEGFGVALRGDPNGTPVSSNISTTLGSSKIENIEGTAFGKVQVYPDQLTIATDNNAYEQVIQLKADNIKFLISDKATTEANTIELYTDRVYTKKYITTDQGFVGTYLQAPSITGSLLGTASFAVSASWAPTQNINTSSLVTTSSFNAFTSSYNTGSFTGSFTGSLLGTASFAVSSSRAVSSSFATTSSIASTLQGLYNVKVTTPSSIVTGTVSEVQLLKLEIPPYSFAADDVLNIPSLIMSKVGTAASYTLRVKLSSSSTMPTGTGTETVAFMSIGNTNIFTKLSRNFIINGGFLKGYPTSNSATDTTNSTSPLREQAFDNTITNYLYVSINPASAADTFQLIGLQINNI